MFLASNYGVDYDFYLDTPGTTILTYTPDGRRVITAGSNSAIRVYSIGQDGEPKTIDEGVEAHFGIAATVNHSFDLERTKWDYTILTLSC